MWMQFIAEKCWSHLEVTWICLILEKVLMRSMQQPRNKSQEAAIKKVMLFQESAGTEDRESRTSGSLLSVPSLVLMTRSVIHSSDQNGGIETSQKIEPKLDSGSKNYTARQVALHILPVWNPQTYWTPRTWTIPGLATPVPRSQSKPLSEEPIP